MSVKLTKKGQLVYQILQEATYPLSVEQINNELKGTAINLATIYRQIDKLHNLGLIGKTIIENRAYYFVSDGHHHHYLICLSCHKMIPIACLLDKKTIEMAKTYQFEVTHHDMTIYGYCQTCQKLNT